MLKIYLDWNVITHLKEEKNSEHYDFLMQNNDKFRRIKHISLADDPKISPRKFIFSFRGLFYLMLYTLIPIQ